MMIFVNILVVLAMVLLFLYITFIFAPGIVVYFVAFSRKYNSKPLSERDLSGTRYEPYKDILLPAERFAYGLPWKRVSVEGEKGIRLCADYLDNGSDKTAIFFHGYRGNPQSNFCTQIKRLNELGWNILGVIERAHGDSGGRMLGLGAAEYRDVLTWIAYEASKPGVEKILLYGSSMGGAAVGFASEHITEPKVRGMVIDCAFTSPKMPLIHDAKMRRVPYRMVLPIIRLTAWLDQRIDIYKSVSDSLSRNKIPAFFLHGSGDLTVEIEQGRQNYEACASQKEFCESAGAQHILAYPAGDETVKKRFDSFLEKYFEN